MSGTDLSAILSNSLTLSSILVLTALGLAITFGVMRVINMAHGDMLMLGGYTAFIVTDSNHLGLNIFWAIPICFLIVALFGYLLEVCLIRFLYNRPLDTLLATWGVGMIIQHTILLIYGTDRQPMIPPKILAGHLNVSGVTIPVYRLFIVGITALCLFAVYAWFYWTSFGLTTRAVVQNRPMASALGISTRRVDSLTFAFATGLAGVAGCILGHIYIVKYNMGNDYIVEAFMVVILGGLGQMSGTVAGGSLIGTGDSIVEKLLNNTPMAKVVMLLVVVLLILIRPSGLFALKGRSYD